jgi:hypothetical protein
MGATRVRNHSGAVNVVICCLDFGVGLFEKSNRPVRPVLIGRKISKKGLA